MASQDTSHVSNDNKRIGWIVSIIIHVLLVLFILFLPQFIKDKPNETYEGVLVSFGLPIESEGDQASSSPSEIAEEEEFEEPEELEEKTSESEIKSSLNEEESPVKVEEQKEVKEVRSENAKPEIIEENPEETLEKARDEFSKLFSNRGTGENESGESGDPLGDRDAEILSGISKGKGKVGGGLDERGLIFEPDIVEHSQKSGKVVVKVCVDNSGKVMSAKYTQRGSTTTDRDLVEVAEISARKYKFMPSEFEEQCGTISINFIVR